MSIRDASNVVPPNPSTVPPADPFVDEGYGTDHDSHTPPGKKHAAKGPEQPPIDDTDEGYGSDTNSGTKAEKRNVRAPEQASVHDDKTHGSDTDTNTTVSMGSTHSFWDQEQKFDSDNESRQRKMNAYLGNKVTDTAAGKPDDDGTQSAKGVFSKGQVPLPHHGVLSKTARALKGNPDLKKISEFITGGLNGTNPKALSRDGATHVAHMAANLAKTLHSAGKAPAHSAAEQISSGSNITSIVFMALAASMDADNKTKAGRLNDMQKFNKISELISDYISNVLQPAQAKLDALTRGKDPQKTQNAEVSVEVWTDVDTDDLFQDAKGNVGLSKLSHDKLLGASGLSTALTAAQGWAQNASNNSSQASNRYQATDTASGNTFSMLTTFIKNVNDTTNAIVHNQV